MRNFLLAVIVLGALLALPLPSYCGDIVDLIFADRFELSDSGGELTCPEDDPFEPNDELGTAGPITPGESIDAIACSGNQDHYVFSVDDGDDLAIVATFSHSEGDLDMQLYRVGETGPLASSSSTTDNEFISHTVAPGDGGNYIVRVFAFGSASNTYSLQVDITSGASP